MSQGARDGAHAILGGVSHLVLFGQGMYYFVGGIWPLLHMRSFTAVTGPKVDLWLVRAVAGLLVVIGGVLTLSALRRGETPELRLLAAGSAIVLASIDVYYSLRRRISRIYLLDAVAQVFLAVAVLATGFAPRSPRQPEELAS